ncbi:hypothetical protein V8G69_06075 [Gaetbulibacter sp. M235]|uniref:hypothetical protein n=1 Tax=Gaetbulibacter sp. M235 TaxID=3126510 RepID=UPI00374EFFD4
MKNIKIITFILAIFMLNTSCENDGGTSVIPLDNGALPDFNLVAGSDDFIKIGGFNNLSLKFTVGIGEGEPTSFDLKAFWLTAAGDLYGPGTFDTNVTSFPKEYAITSTDIFNAFSELNSVADVSVGDRIMFFTSFKLADGTVLDVLNSNGEPNYYAADFSQITDYTIKFEYFVICPPQPGNYRVVMHDSFGDGWQTDDPNGGSGIIVTVDGVDQEVGMCSPYIPSTFECTPSADGFEADEDAIITIPEGALKATWNFPGDAYGEIGFEIYGPGDELLLESGFGEAGAGVLPVTLCAQ